MKLIKNKAKGRISKRVFQESKARQNFRETNISYPLIRTCTGKKCLFFGNFGVLCFLETPVLRFARLPYYRRIKERMQERLKSPVVLNWLVFSLKLIYKLYASLTVNVVIRFFKQGCVDPMSYISYMKMICTSFHVYYPTC